MSPPDRQRRPGSRGAPERNGVVARRALTLRRRRPRDLRYDSPVTYVPREAAVDTRLNGTEIAAGRPIVAMLGAANRDPRTFPKPDRFRLDRHVGNDQIDFGRGISYCLGAPLATIEGEVAFEMLARSLDRFELAVPEYELEWRPTIWARGLTGLPIVRSPAWSSDRAT